VSKNYFNKFYNAIPISSEFLNVDLSDYEQSKKILKRINGHFNEDLESIVSSALITRYVANIEKMRTDNLTKIVFAGGVGQNYKKLHTTIKETFHIQIEVPKIDESTLQGLGYLSRNLSK
jgi:hydrogenase maturation factor HypF (carbamoyltransferase family)